MTKTQALFILIVFTFVMLSVKDIIEVIERDTYQSTILQNDTLKADNERLRSEKLTGVQWYNKIVNDRCEKEK